MEVLENTTVCKKVLVGRVQMIGKLRKATKGKPCSCPAHKTCTHCVKKNGSPHVYVEDAHRLPFPIKITRHKENKPAVRFKEQKTITNIKIEPKLKEKKIKIIRDKEKVIKHKEEKRKYDYLNPKRKSQLSEWYKKRKEARELKNYNERERQRENKERLARKKADRLKEKEERELKNYYERERKRENKERLAREKADRLKEKEVLKKLESQKKKKKTQSESRYISVKSNHYDDITNKFVNCCYRLCCQFYCCVSVIIIGFVIVLLI